MELSTDRVESSFRIKMTTITDTVQVKNGADYSFVCGKIPFAITCSSTLQHGAYNLIDLDLVNKMKIPLQRIKVCRMTYLGENLRSVGFIDQTIQCVKNGVVQGTIHLSAKVVRNLFDNFNVDCIASLKTFEKLTGNKPPDPPDTKDDQTEDIKEKILGDDEDGEEYSSASSSCCSDGRHEPVSKEWLFGATLIAQTAQKDGVDTLIEIANGLANVGEDDKNEDNSETENDNTNDSMNDACTNDEDENEENKSDEELHCELCFRFGQPVRITTNHDTFCPTCPTMTPLQKEVEIGTDWKAKAEVIIRRRFEREKQRRKGSADQ